MYLIINLDISFIVNELKIYIFELLVVRLIKTITISMFYTAETLDDLLYDVLKDLIDLPFDITASRGTSSEVFGVLLKLTNPRARISRTETKGKPFSALGELLWYLSKDNRLDFIQYYLPKYEDDSEDKETIRGGYGPRIFNMHDKYDQLQCMIDLLKTSPNTRRAVIQIFDATDTEKKYKEIPCTCTMQFAIRNNKLNMYVSMRSNDAFIGLPHDVFAFTMLQEIIARTLNIELGTYNHSVGSLHLYEKNKKQALEYLSEGFQSTKITMPEMPIGDPWKDVEVVKQAEFDIRNSKNVDAPNLGLEPYWTNLIYLLLIHSSFKKNEIKEVEELQKKINYPMYNTYIDNRLKRNIEAEKSK